MHRPALPQQRGALLRWWPATSLPRLPAWLVVWLVVLGWLAGCGVGVGGTGTGDRSGDLPAFGATAASVCGGSLAPVVGCTNTTLPDMQPTSVSFFVDSSGTRRARVDGNDIELQLLCDGRRFVGTWGTVGGQPARYYGHLTQAAGESLASMTVLALADGNSLQVQVFGEDGRALAGPYTLVRSAAPTTVVICG